MAGDGFEQLSGIDSSFLSIETPTTYGHVASLLVLDPGDSGADDVYATLQRTLRERLHLMPLYRRKLVDVPLHLDHPYWVDDPNLDLEFHLREIALPAPGDQRQLCEQVARITARPLDRSRPLWEFYVISGLSDGRVGVLTKIHHSTIDGVSGAELLHVLLDREPHAEAVEPPAESWDPRPPPSPAALLTRTLIAYATRPQKAVQLQLRLLRMLAGLSGNAAVRRAVTSAMPGLRRLGVLEPGTGEERPALPNRPAPRTPFNRVITPHRRFAMRTLSLSDAQDVKRAFGVTVNDVVLSICAGALRRYLEDREALPADPLVAMVPISVRSEDERGVYGTRVVGAVSLLHTDVADPVARLRAIHGSMKAAKELQEAVPATVLTDLTHFAPPALAARAARLVSRMRITDRLNPPVNLTISNVPGPRQPLYLSGARMEHFYPVSMVVDGQGLNMTVQSYLDNLDFGIVSCRELVPDVWELCDGIEESMNELVKAAGEV